MATRALATYCEMILIINIFSDNFLLGDSTYPCLSQLIGPFKDNGQLTRNQRLFNQKLSSCRVVIENAFGCLKQRFHQLYNFKLKDTPWCVLYMHVMFYITWPTYKICNYFKHQ